MEHSRPTNQKIEPNACITIQKNVDNDKTKRLPEQNLESLHYHTMSSKLHSKHNFVANTGVTIPENPGEPPVAEAIPIDSWSEPATSCTESSGSSASCNFIPIVAVAMVVVLALSIAIITLELRFRAMSGGGDASAGACSSATGGDC